MSNTRRASELHRSKEAGEREEGGWNLGKSKLFRNSQLLRTSEKEKRDRASPSRLRSDSCSPACNTNSHTCPIDDLNHIRKLQDAGRMTNSYSHADIDSHSPNQRSESV